MASQRHWPLRLIVESETIDEVIDTACGQLLVALQHEMQSNGIASALLSSFDMTISTE